MFSQRLRWLCGFVTPVILLIAASLAAAENDQQLAQEILEATGVRGGLIVHLNCGEGELTAALRAGKQFQVHGLDRDADNVRHARRRLRELGGYGEVSVDRLQGNRLPYIDNLANLLVAEDLGEISQAEALRVLAPGGVAYIKQDGSWKKTVKPRPENIDEWTHFLHDASGNAVAHDDVVGPPRHLQWLGSPRWSRHHDRMASMSALVSTQGRIFYIMDEGSRVSIQLPPRWKLIARDAFNGVVLWKQPIQEWQNHLWPLKSGPTQLARRLVAVGERVYVTLGYQAPLTCLDAVTGETIRTYDDTKSTEEVILSNGVLFLVVNKNSLELAKYAPQLNVGDQARVRREYHWNQQPRRIMAIQADSGELLWTKQTRVAPLSLAADGNQIYFHDGEKVVCLHRKNGEQRWASKPAARRPDITFNFGPRLVVHEDVVLYAGGDRAMRGLSAQTGKVLWTASHARSGYQSPEDILVAGGLVWCAATTSTRDDGVFTGRDPKTGEAKVEFPPNVETYWFHHRCHIAKATDKFLIPSRTGIEFVDHEKKNWDIHHWVRGGCLYGVMPCNGLLYAPPHNCACYPEAKLYGLNVLAPSSPSRNLPDRIVEEGRLERGPAFAMEVAADASPRPETVQDDWPTYRGGNQRSGFTPAKVAAELQPAWRTKLGGRLSAVTVAGGKLFVAQIDAHTVHALDANSGEKQWSYTAGGRIDSPPTIYQGRAVFGCADGWVYCLRTADGELIWRYRAAPDDRRLMALEQLESVWPVHGSVLIEHDVASFVAGRSTFLDGGLRMLRLDVKTGEKLSETVLNDRDPTTGDSVQKHIKTLNMPVGLPDVLSSDDEFVYMRSQRFSKQGQRLGLAPHSGDPSAQGSVQRGQGKHLFAPMGYLDGTWFHRSYWVYGRSFAGGHAGYYQAGKYAPSGRILVFDDDNIYGYGRKAQYLRWTTPLEHQLFSTSKQPPAAPKPPARRAGGRGAGRGGSMVRIKNSPSLDPTNKALTVEAWVRSTNQRGVVLARGGPANGYALVIQQGRPKFMVRTRQKLAQAEGKRRIVNRWAHLAGVLTKDMELQLYVDGKLAATAKAPELIAADPQQATQIGADEGGSVGGYRAPFPLTGLIDEVRIYHRALSENEISARYNDPTGALKQDSGLVLSIDFEQGKATDNSGKQNNGAAAGAAVVAGKFGRAIRFTGRGGRGGNRAGGSLVKHGWAKDVPIFARAMVLADQTLFLAGPPDLMDEEETFKKLTARDPRVAAKLAEQDAALQGEHGGRLWAVSAADGAKLSEFDLDALPVWDGMAVAAGRLYFAAQTGEVLCLKAK